MSQLIGHLRLARYSLLRAARAADQRQDTERHERIMSALVSVDDALDLNRPLTEEVREMLEENGS